MSLKCLIKTTANTYPMLPGSTLNQTCFIIDYEYYRTTNKANCTPRYLYKQIHHTEGGGGFQETVAIVMGRKPITDYYSTGP